MKKKPEPAGAGKPARATSNLNVVMGLLTAGVVVNGARQLMADTAWSPACGALAIAADVLCAASFAALLLTLLWPRRAAGEEDVP